MINQIEKGCKMLAESSVASFKAKELGITKSHAIESRKASFPINYSESEKKLSLAMIDIAYNVSDVGEAYAKAMIYVKNYVKQEISKRTR